MPTIVGELRRHVRERASASSVAELEEETLAAGARSQAEVSETRELVRAALDVLTPRERRIVALRYYRDWSQQSIAAEVGLSQVQVSRVLSASLAKIATGSRRPDAAMRRIVRTASSPYTRRLVSAQPSASDIHEGSRTKTPPSPSGRLLLRMPPDLHGELAQAAERDGTSLNGYIIARLGEAVGRTQESGAAASSGLSAVTVRRLLIANVVTVALASVAALAILLVAWLG